VAVDLTPPRLSVEGADLSGLLRRLDDRPVVGRLQIGLTGPPGVGKSTLAIVLVEQLRGRAAVVPLDGFHLADVELERQGLLGRKGAPETFDGWGYAALLGRLRKRPDHVVYAPGFERDLEQPLAGAVPVAPDVDVVVTEGNYLLLDLPPWRAARDQLDEVWYVDSQPDLRRERLVARHVAHGKEAGAAARWVEEVDGPNAELVAVSRSRADLVVDVTGWTGGQR
jgi:pantothenate kinase